MEQDAVTLFTLFAFSMFIFWLIGQDVFNRMKIGPKIKCLLGAHVFFTMVDGRPIKKYICTNCKRTRRFPKLKLIDGGNKLPCKRRKI